MGYFVYAKYSNQFLDVTQIFSLRLKNGKSCNLQSIVGMAHSIERFCTENGFGRR